MLFIFRGTLLFWCVSLVLSQWDCMSLLNRDEFYGNVSEYCDNYECGFQCEDPVAVSRENSLCSLRGGSFLPTCFSSYGEVETCDFPACNEHAGCYYPSTNGTDYRGIARYTENGYRCIQWNDVIFESWNTSGYSNADLEDSYCRNPDNRERPWCFYVDRFGNTQWNYCHIPACKSTLLSEFTRIPNLYNSAVPNPPGVRWESTFFDEYTLDMEEKCARLCVEETLFTCRQFHLAIGPRYCEWLEYGEYHQAQRVEYRYDTMGDTFIRKHTFCDGFYLGRLQDSCMLPLGMESGWIQDIDIRATTFLDDDHAPHFARLHGNSSWIPHPSDRNPAIQVTLPERMIISGMLIQGGGETNNLFTPMFHVSFRVEGYDRVIYYQQSLDDEQIQFFSGNIESTCVVQVFFPRPIYTHEIQVWPFVRAGPVALRLEFLGCRDNDCDESLLTNLDTTSVQRFISSSFQDVDSRAGQAVLNPFRRGEIGWIPRRRDPNAWWQVTFPMAQNIAGLMSRQCGDEVIGLGWLIKFDLTWGLPGFTRLTTGQNQTIYDLLLDYSEGGSLARLYFAEKLRDTQIVRISPTDWGGDYNCMAVELMGCAHSEYSLTPDDEEHDDLIGDISCKGCNPDTLLEWRLHQYASDASSGVEFTSETDKWLEIELTSPYLVSGLETQGGTERNISLVGDLTNQIDDYTISYQHEDNGPWRQYVDYTGYHLVFSGLRDPFGVKTSNFYRPFLAVRLRINLRQHETVNKGRVRFRVRGSKLIDISQICGDEELLYKGYCLGVIALEEDDVCNRVFLPDAYPLAIKSEEIQNFLLAKRDKLPLAAGLVIGLKSDVNGTYSWPDGTPVLFDNFDPNTETSLGIEQCAFINFFNCFVWELYDCTPLQRSTVCQADLNECVAPNHGCAQTCVNDDGGYHCSCEDGYRLEGLSDCEDVCINPFDDQNRTWVSIGLGACLHPILGTGTYEEAENACRLFHGRMPTLEEVPRLQDVLNRTESLFWIKPFDASVDAAMVGVSPVCPAADTSKTGNVSALLPNCMEILNYACIRDISNTRIQDLFDDGVDYISLNASYGYIELRGFAPWYYTGRKIDISISGIPGQQIRLDILSVSLRTSRDGPGCKDRLSIHDLERQSVREVCGHLPSFRLIMESRIILQIEIGDLQATMESIDFSLYYEIVDCYRERCVTGCGESTLVYQHGVLETAPFPSIFSPFSECNVRISGPMDKYIAIEFTDYRINVGSNGEQCGDGLVIDSYDWNEAVERTCDAFPPLFITNTNTVDVRLYLGLEKTSEGFQANVTFLDKPGCFESSLDQCSSVVYDCGDTSGIIISPYYPRMAIGVMECRWHITTPENSYVRLHFTNMFFPMECSDMSVTVHEQDAAEGTDIQLGRFCRGKLPIGLIESSLNVVTIALRNSVEQYGITMMVEYDAVFFEAPNSNHSHTDKPCPPSTTEQSSHWDHFSGSCYQFIQLPQTLTWMAAEVHCASIAEGGHLVSIRTRAEARFIHYMMTSYWTSNETNTYIGLGNRNYRGIFQWTDGFSMTYTDWFIPPHRETDGIRPLNQPDGGLLDACVQIFMSSVRSTALWHDIPCLAHTTNQFICKVPAISQNKDISQTASVQLDFASPSVVPRCPSVMSTCGTGECVHSVYICDGQIDCADGSDESNCASYVSCSSTSFTCSNGECIPMSFYCDHVTHCKDGSDEMDCAPYNCSSGEFQCANGRCIPYELKCDLVDHCFDNSDEMSCDSKSNNRFTCFNGDGHPLTVRCDGIVDCIGSSSEDELETCAYRRLDHKCEEKEILCNNGACAEHNSYCFYDVSPSGYITGCRDVSHLRLCENFECPAYSMKCPNSYCIPLRFRCNRVLDCPNGEDELGCDRFVCPPGIYSCRGSNICLPPEEVCDGIRHCPAADDEQFCGVSCPSGCNCTGLVFICNLPPSGENSTFIFSRTAKKIVITGAPLYLSQNTTDHVTPVSGDQEGDHVTGYISFWPSTYPFLAELELEDNGIKTIPATAFSRNQNLYYLSFRQNPIESIKLGAFANLTRLRVLDIRESTIPSNNAIREALQQIPSLHTVYAESYAFCCMLDLVPADEDDRKGCFAPIDQFSSCDDLLKDNTLRVFMWILGISALAGNLCTILLRVFKSKAVSSTRMIQSRLITHLAISDLIMGIYMLIIAIADQYYMGDYAIHADKWRQSIVCRAAGFMSALSSEVSVFIIMLISIDRILCIVFSQHHHIQLSNKSSYACLAIVWISALVITLVPVFKLGYFEQFYGRSSVCLGLPLTTDKPPGWEYSLSIFLGLNLICFLVTAVCYVTIYVVVHRSASKISKARDGGRHVKNGVSMQVKLATRMALIVGTDFICWMPIIIMGFLAESGTVEIPADVYAWTAVFILPLNSSLNPYLYTISAIWQHHKAKQRQKALKECDGTHLSLSAAVATSSKRTILPRPVQKKYTHLTKQCILTPYNATSITLPVVPLSKYIENRGQPPSLVDSSLILRDVRKAVAYLKAKSVTHIIVSEDQIAVQLNDSGEIVHAFLVNADIALLETLSVDKQERRASLHRDFMTKFMENILDLEPAADVHVVNGQKLESGTSGSIHLIADSESVNH